MCGNDSFFHIHNPCSATYRHHTYVKGFFFRQQLQIEMITIPLFFISCRLPLRLGGRRALAVQLLPVLPALPLRADPRGQGRLRLYHAGRQPGEVLRSLQASVDQVRKRDFFAHGHSPPQNGMITCSMIPSHLLHMTFLLEHNIRS